MENYNEWKNHIKLKKNGETENGCLFSVVFLPSPKKKLKKSFMLNVYEQILLYCCNRKRCIRRKRSPTLDATLVLTANTFMY